MVGDCGGVPHGCLSLLWWLWVCAWCVCMWRSLIIRPLDTRVGTIDVAIPKLRSGTYFPEWLLQRRKRSESALITVVADCYLAGVSTRRMDKLVKTLGITGLSKSQVSRMAADLDEHVDQFRNRPLHDAGPFTFVAADALTMKVREGLGSSGGCNGSW